MRQWRERMDAAGLGLPAGSPRRRTPGLRREELAQLAGLSIDYIVRLEQARGPHPSPSVLQALARALQLSTAEGEHLFTLAGVPVPATTAISDQVRPSVMRLLERLTDLPAMIVNARGDILAWNNLIIALLGDLSAVPRERRTHLWLHFVADENFASRLVTDDGSGDRLDRSTVAQARAAAARYPDDYHLHRTVEDLRTRVPRFAALWDERPLEPRHSDVKSYDVPGLGRITLDCESLAVPDDDQTLVVYSAAPGTPDSEKLDRLRMSAATF